MVKYIETQQDVDELIIFLDSVDIVAIDTETSGLDPIQDKLLLIAIGNEEDQYVVDCSSVDYSFLKSYLEDPHLTKIFHNLKFDYKVLKHNLKFSDWKSCYCTYIGEYLYLAGSKKIKGSLKDLANKYLGISLDKNIRNSFQIQNKKFTNSQIEYAANDVKYLISIYNHILSNIIKYNLYTTYKMECEAALLYGDIEYNGIYLNKEYWQKNIINNYKQMCLEKLKELDEYVYNHPDLIEYRNPVDLFGNIYDTKKTNVNFNSSEQLAKIFKKLNINTTIKNDDYEEVFSTSKDAIKNYEGSHPLLNLLIEYREYQKILSSFGENMFDYIHPVTNRIHAEFRQLGTMTGRVSCTNPNLQNIPKKQEFRSGFQAREGFVLITADYQGAELRIMAHASGDPSFIEACKTEDPHAYIATLMYKRPITKQSDPVIRDRQKTINFGLAYGAGPEKFAKDFKSSVSEAKEILNVFFKTFPKLHRYLIDSGKSASLRKYSVTLPPYQRIRWYNPHAREKAEFAAMEREGKNHVIQGTCADIVKQASVNIRNYILINQLENDCFIVNQVHDEIVIECRESLAKTVAKDVVKIMEEVGNSVIYTVPMIVDFDIAKYWKK